MAILKIQLVKVNDTSSFIGLEKYVGFFGKLSVFELDSNPKRFFFNMITLKRPQGKDLNFKKFTMVASDCI